MMNVCDQVFGSLRQVDTACVDYLAVLNYVDSDLPHADVDVFAILRTECDVRQSQQKYLYAFMKSFRDSTSRDAHAFSSFRHQMFFENELRRKGITSTPIHLLVYPGSFYLHRWEIPSRIRSMIRTSRRVYRSRTWKLGAASPLDEPYQPFVFLQALYEAYILWAGSNIESNAVTMDVLKKLEFACKNLAIEALLKSEGMTTRFETSWSYLIDHLAGLKQEGVPVQAVERAWKVKKQWRGSVKCEDMDAYFHDAFEFYDGIIACMFSD